MEIVLPKESFCGVAPQVRCIALFKRFTRLVASQERVRRALDGDSSSVSAPKSHGASRETLTVANPPRARILQFTVASRHPVHLLPQSDSDSCPAGRWARRGRQGQARRIEQKLVSENPSCLMR
ncbi:hypothetical protein CSIM01_10979 [Colletotrichum simmondsii]|uniref:Uncharacterized protein n=1 Tax=Colletotrichum simmondsii TaxID=703756 RepID=A0A135TIL7_9PEZI|nr:hypothetical protein CSIM01_10979 [Colletotrichum simmondsii]